MNIKYRPEIDGLRTIAVLAVIIYHADIFFGNTQLLKGGFLGVDVFFVISGYLITSIIMKEYSATGTFSIAYFYERRARRLLPALLTVILVSIPFAWHLLLPSQLVDYAKSVLSTLAFGSNFYWHYSLQEYGAESALLKPFLHTWTLAVEEQFYIIFPLILIAIHRWLKPHVVVLLLAMLLLSLQLSEWLSVKDASLSFYMLMTRFWELLAGALLANILYFHPRKENDALLNKAMPILGLYLIVYSLVFIDLSSVHPGFVTLLPVIGTVLIIWFGSKDELVTKMLSTKLFVGIGLISYSLYLWHYPIFAFGRFMDMTPSWHDKSLWVVVTIIASTLTYMFIEKPFRNKNKLSLKKFIIVIASASLAVVFMMGYFIKADGVGKRFDDVVSANGGIEVDRNKLGLEAWSLLESINIEHGYDAFARNSRPATKPSKSELHKSWFSNEVDTTKILVIGNSHGRDVFNALESNQDLFQGSEFARFGIRSDATDKQIEALVNSPNFQEADILLYVQRFSTGKELLELLPSFLEKLKRHGKEIILTSNRPTFLPYEGHENIVDGFINENKLTHLNEANEIHYRYLDPKITALNNSIEKIAIKAGVRFIDTYEVVCELDKKICHGLTPEGRKTHYDDNHWTVSGAKFFGERIYELNWLQLEEKDSLR